MAISRRIIREILFKVIFMIEFNSLFKKNNMFEVSLMHLQTFLSITEFDLVKKDKYFLDTLDGIKQKYNFIRKKIEKFAPSWPIDNINIVDRSILYFGVYEILFNNNVPDVVAINEAIELGKKFGNDTSSKFINGVLNTCMQNKK